MTPKNIRELFLSLPDSLFMKENRCFNPQNDSFPISERKRMLEISDSAIDDFVDEPRFLINSISDSLGQLTVTSVIQEATTLRILELDKGECFFSISNYHGDIDLSYGTWFFYTIKDGKIKEVSDVLPESYGLDLFFDATYLAQNHFDFSLSPSDLLILYDPFSGVLTGSLQTEIFDPELMGADDPKTKLDPKKIIKTQITFKLKKRKFVIEDK